MEIFESSPKVKDVTLKLQPIVEAIEKLSHGESTTFGKDADATFIEEVAREYSKGKKAFVVVEHDDCLELSMLPCGQTRTMFYNLIKGHTLKTDSESGAESIVIDKLSDFVNSDWDSASAYMPNLEDLFSDLIMPYSYIQRRVTTISAFKRSKDGSKVTLEKVIESLCKRGILKLQSKENMKKIYGKSPRSYSINRVLLREAKENE